MICGYSAVKVKFDTAMRNQAFGSASSSRSKNAQAWLLFQTENETADAVKQTNIF